MLLLIYYVILKWAFRKWWAFNWIWDSRPWIWLEKIVFKHVATAQWLDK